MNLLRPVSDIMTTNLLTLSPSSSIAEAAKIFKAKRIHHIPVVEVDELVGIVSKSDFLFFQRGFLNTSGDNKLEEVRMNNYDVKQIMTTGIAKLEPTDRINVVLEIFKVNKFHALPVVDGKKLVGIVTTFDIINMLASDGEATSQY